jgi:hypothetical protein
VGARARACVCLWTHRCASEAAEKAAAEREFKELFIDKATLLKIVNSCAAFRVRAQRARAHTHSL